MSPDMDRFTTSDGLSLAYADQGAGLPVLCLPGLTRNSADFDPLVRLTGQDVRLIRLDPRGRGASEYAADFATYAVPVEARDALELLDHLGIEDAVIIGSSRGGLLAMTLAATAPQRLRGVLLNDVGPVLEPVGLEVIMAYLGKPPVSRTLAEEGARLATALAAEFPSVSADVWTQKAANGLTETPDGLELRYDPRLRDAVLAQADLPIPDLWPLFGTLAGRPVAALRGANSTLLSEQTFAEMARHLPDMAAVTVPDRGHIPFLDEPESASAIDALLERCR